MISVLSGRRGSLYASVAQSVEQLIRNQQVTSSNLVSSSKKPVAFAAGFLLTERFELRSCERNEILRIIKLKL